MTPKDNSISKQLRVLFVHGSSQNIAGQEIALLNTIIGLREIGVHMDSSMILRKYVRARK